MVSKAKHECPQRTIKYRKKLCTSMNIVKRHRTMHGVFTTSFSSIFFSLIFLPPIHTIFLTFHKRRDGGRKPRPEHNNIYISCIYYVYCCYKYAHNTEYCASKNTAIEFVSRMKSHQKEICDYQSLNREKRKMLKDIARRYHTIV